MKELADISTFNRLAIENSEADSFRAGYIKQYRSSKIPDTRPFFRYLFGKKLTQPHKAETDIGAALMGQQARMPYFKIKGVYSDFWEQLDQYRKESALFRHMYANAELDGNADDVMRKLRRQLIDFDSSIENFANILSNNSIYKEHL